MKKTLLLLCGLALGTSAFAAEPALHVMKRFALGGDGGWDALSVDPAARRLYISRATHVMVVDLESGKIAGDIIDTPGVHDIALAPALGRGFISNGRADNVTIFDLKTMKAVGTVATGANPDLLLYDPASGRVFAFNGRSNDATVFDAATGTVVATLALGGKPEFARADGKGVVFVNIEDTSEVVAIDSRKSTVLTRMSLAPGEGPTGMAFDAEHRLVFSTCHNKLMTVLDPETGKVVATVPIDEGVDGCEFDPATGYAYSSNGIGTLTVVRQTASGTFEVVATVPTQRGARTMTIDPTTHLVYLPAAEFGTAPAATPENPRPRPPIVKDSFTVLVVGQ